MEQEVRGNGRGTGEQAPQASQASQASQAPQERKVLHWLNSVKGLGVILVIFGHLMGKSTLLDLNQFIYSFHMPLFFLTSGYVQKTALRRNYLGGKALRLLPAFFFYTLVSLPVFLPLQFRKGTEPMQMVIDTFYLHGRIYNNPLWFLAVLFEIYCLFFLLHKALGHPALQLLFCLGAFGFGYWITLQEEAEVWNTLGFNRVVVCFGFFLAGMLLRRLPLEQVRPWHWLLPPLLLLPGWYVGNVLNEKVSLYAFRLGNYPCFVLGALLLSMGVLILGRLVLDRPWYLSWLSGYSILFLGTQFLWIKPFQTAMKAQGLLSTPDYDRYMLLAAAVYILLAPLLYELLKKLLPYLK